MPKLRTPPTPRKPTEFRDWRTLVFASAATVFFIVVCLGITAYLTATHRGEIDTDDVPTAAAERFGRFRLPPTATDFRAQARGGPLAGELMLRFRLPPADLQQFLASTPIPPAAGPLTPDRKLLARITPHSDRPWWKPQAARTFLAAQHDSEQLLFKLLIDTSDPAGCLVYIYASNR
jgi:hypothetical protein